jgi:flagellar basal-body rod protein FlgC
MANVIDGGFRGAFRSLGISSSGLSAQRARIEVVADNIANAETTRTADGTPFRRRAVALQQRPFDAAMARADSAVLGPRPPRAPQVKGAPEGSPADAAPEGGVEVAEIVQDDVEGPRIYDPGHPDADEDGFVQMPNVEVSQEMVSLLEARRLYEANATVFDAVKQMLRRATQI